MQIFDESSGSWDVCGASGVLPGGKTRQQGIREERQRMHMMGSRFGKLQAQLRDLRRGGRRVCLCPEDVCSRHPSDSESVLSLCLSWRCNSGLWTTEKRATGAGVTVHEDAGMLPPQLQAQCEQVMLSRFAAGTARKAGGERIARSSLQEFVWCLGWFGLNDVERHYFLLQYVQRHDADGGVPGGRRCQL